MTKGFYEHSCYLLMVVVMVVMEEKEDICKSSFGVYDQQGNCWPVWYRGHIHLCKILPAAFQSGCSDQYFFQQCVKFHNNPDLLQYFVLSDFFIFTHKMGTKWHVILVLICIALLTNAAGHFFTIFPRYMFLPLGNTCSCLYIFYQIICSFFKKKSFI